ncbi:MULTISPECIES: metal-dependent hydrolase [Halolamina]|uniref:LexA-binding, inner membrane-associated putative hydrolase n=1 Tax=Halolamina pelagica TaxID=699431 RepID=A0A1I5TZM9_9EURY|nr:MULTISPECIES: metal-dependent hydrolase [Halolamina]NHX36720.1 metal-dependent hydrolase [Halolamina sp. R1-12]SFP88494.1 LexA-binding, inner membrane-associated putative hydrolase [Halolamina pelagica]
MFVGHALLAFALVGGTAALLTDRRVALRLGIVAAAFATVPDVDMVYALAGLVGAEGGVMGTVSSFWAASTAVHRTITHSLLVAPVAAGLAGAWLHGRRTNAPQWLGVAVVLGAGLGTVATLVSGALGGAVMAVFVVAAVAVAEGVEQYTEFGPRATAAAGLVGLLSHPFGDLATGEPPAFLYPLNAPLVTERVALADDATLHLLGAFGVELAAIWAGLLVAMWLLERPIRTAIDFRAVVGVGYALAALAIPAPTLDFSYHFVFSVLSVGMIGAVPRVRFPNVAVERPDAISAALTGLAAVTLAGMAYAVTYTLV